MNTVLLSMVLSLCSVGISQTNRYDFPMTGEIDRISAVIHPNIFICTLKDSPLLDGIPLRVQIRGLAAPADPNRIAQGIQFLDSALRSHSGRITLKNIRFGTYFHAVADIYAGKDNLAEVLIKHGFATLDKPTPQIPPPASKPLSSKPAERASPPVVPIITKKAIQPLAARLQAKVDLSSLTPETTLSEAIDIIRRSVEPQLPIVVIWNDLNANAMIGQDSPIGVKGIRQIRVLDMLRTIAQSLSAISTSRVVVVPQQEVITISSEAMANSRYQGMVYPVTDIISTPAAYGQTDNSQQTTGTY